MCIHICKYIYIYIYLYIYIYIYVYLYFRLWGPEYFNDQEDYIDLLKAINSSNNSTYGPDKNGSNSTYIGNSTYTGIDIDTSNNADRDIGNSTSLGIGNNFLLFVWSFFFTYALLAVVYVSHVENRFLDTPRL
jgi:hypothetical protein